MVRAANTGISAVIDPAGRIVARLGLGIEGVLDARLPAAMPPTIYARIGDIPAAIMIVRRIVAGHPAASLSEAPEACIHSYRRRHAESLQHARIPPVDRSTVHFRILRLRSTKNNPVTLLCSNCLQLYPILRAGFDGTGA